MLSKYNKAFWNQKCRSADRGIGFKLSLAEWLAIWEKSGKLALRGRGLGKYCMARFGDKGPYAIGNVRIVSNEVNRAEMHLSDATRHKMRLAKLGQKLSKEHRARIAASNTGKIMSVATKRKMRACKLGKKNPMFGRKASAATRAKLSKIHMGAVFSPERRAKIGLAIRRAWARKRRNAKT